MTPTAIALLVIVLSLISLQGLVAVLSLEALKNALTRTAESNERMSALVRELQDRLMAKDFGQFKDYQLAQGGAEEPSIEPGEPPSRPWRSIPVQMPEERSPLAEGQWIPPEERGIDPSEARETIQEMGG